MMFNVTLDPAVAAIWQGEVVIGGVCIDCLADAPPISSNLKPEIDSTLRALRKTGDAVFQEPVVQALRATFKAVPDMDPARYRPASEALIRRCFEKDFMRINPIVDVNNLLSVKLRLPLGVYDRQRVAEDCVYRLGYDGETYLTISNSVKNASGKLVLADPRGVIGSPVSDSGRAIIRNGTTQIVVLAYLPFGVSRTHAEEICTEIRNGFERFLGAENAQSFLLTN